MSKKRIIILSLTIISIVSLLFFSTFSSRINNEIEKGFQLLKGEEQPDSNIILIHISSNDIENLGDWPLKRSYYALIIENLLNLGVNKIGLEVYLTENLTSQKIYNSVLNASMIGTDKVVLASLAEELTLTDNGFRSTKILFPSPKKSNQSLPTGHINFVENEGIIIPHTISYGDTIERSFSSSLFLRERLGNSYKLNIICSWESFRNYTLLEFFELLENNDIQLTHFKDKYVIIGVSDPLISKSITTGFDKYLPGLGLHALALDNILNDRNLNYEYLDISKFIFIILALLLAIVNLRLTTNLLIFAGLLIALYIIRSFVYLQLDNVAILFPLLLLLVGEFSIRFFENKELLNKSKEISEKLKQDLFNKEETLKNLKNELKEKSENPPEDLLQKINNLEREIDKLKLVESEDTEEFQQRETPQMFEGIVYLSKKMERVVDLIKKVAPENASVLILGESGSGKELVANAIHNLSRRRENKFVAINCAALPDNLLESELFGHVKGAFTDAVIDKIGRFEEADNGTLFLDEIGETSENFQSKLLRVLQTGEFQRVGSSQTQKVDVRIVAATNKNLQELINVKKFREDLYYRLNVVSIEVPKLSERKEDIPFIAEFFSKREDQEFKLSKGVMNKLVENEWNGNIRELESAIKRSLIFAKSENRKIIQLKDLPESMSKFKKDEIEDLVLESLLEKQFSHSSVIETANELGISRTIVSENFRGLFFRIFFENSFNIDESVSIISDSDDEEIKLKLRSKLQKYITNIERDLEGHKDSSFETIKSSFGSKYQNLPQKYHTYLDSIIKHLISN